jgi:RNA 3'-terminal phosphate cyclase (ATP)
VAQVEEYLASGVPVGVHLADQLVLLLALPGGGSFTTLAPTDHSRTQLDLIRRSLGRDVAFSEERGHWRLALS